MTLTDVCDSINQLIDIGTGEYMSLALAVVLFAFGIVLVAKGGDKFVDASKWLAEICGIPKLVIGATIVSIGTTLPELLVSLIATGGGKIDMAVANPVGSVSANMAFILGLSLTFMPVTIKRRKYLFKILLLLIAPALLFVLSFKCELGLVDAAILLAVFIAFVAENIRSASKDMNYVDEKEVKRRITGGNKEIALNVVEFIFGAAAVAVGAWILVKSGSELALVFGVSERVVSVIAIALGTSLPELATTVSAIRKRQYSISLGNLIGASIMNISFILPLCVFVSGGRLAFSTALVYDDMPICVALCVIAVVPTLITKKFSRWQGYTLLCIYLVYFLFTCGFITL